MPWDGHRVYFQESMFADVCPRCENYADLTEVRRMDNDEPLERCCKACLAGLLMREVSE